ncbi:MAG: hypothetical protein LBK99_01635 [Opitutaceae bacterium]|jgi:hypothetical protein|nr:hypothetical protein [Opitutaceae bacterium]
MINVLGCLAGVSLLICGIGIGRLITLKEWKKVDEEMDDARRKGHDFCAGFAAGQTVERQASEPAPAEPETD